MWQAVHHMLLNSLVLLDATQWERASREASLDCTWPVPSTACASCAERRTCVLIVWRMDRSRSHWEGLFGLA